jgi:site-specific DNA recombinase
MRYLLNGTTIRAERTVAGMRAAAEKGRWTFRAPIGYHMVSSAGHARMEPDPEKARLVRAAFELFATGRYEQEQVLRQVIAQGRTRRGKKLTLQSFGSMLRKPIYAGRVSLPCWGIDRLGEFQPNVSEELFLCVQAVLNGRRTIAASYQKTTPRLPIAPFC